MTTTRSARAEVRQAAGDALLFGVVGLLVVAPWIGSGWLLLLDWTSGPSAALPDSAYGLDATQLDAMPARVVVAALRHTVGPRAAAWLPIAAALAVAGTGAARLAGGDRLRRWAAGLLFVVNPFVFERVRAGHVLLLAGYAVLPWMVASFQHARASGRWFRVRSAAWLAVAASASPHLFWVGVVALGATLVAPRPTWRDLVRSGLVVLAAAGAYAYGLVLFLAGVRVQSVSSADLDAFAPAGDGTLDRLVRLVGLHGFWRDAPGTPRDVLGPLWLPLVAAVVAVVVLGARTALTRPAERDRTLGLLVMGGAGLVLAMGATGPTGGLYAAAVEHVPFFAVMRESQKFLMLTALAASVLFGGGVARAAAAAPGSVRLGRVAAGAAAAVLVVAATPTLLWGLGGSVGTSEVPSSWAEAERVMGPGSGAVLALPWYQYQAYPFTDGRTVRTPLGAFLSRPVITSDALDLPGLRSSSTSPRSAYLDRLLARAGELHSAGALLAPLGIEYVLSTATATEPPPSWPEHQVDLEPVLRTGDLTLYRITAPGPGRVQRARTVSSLDELIGLAERGELGAEVVLPAGTRLPEGAPEPVRCGGALPTGPGGSIERRSPVAWDIDAGPAGWTSVPQVAAPGWRGTVASVYGTVAVPADGGAATLTYRPWDVVRWGYAVSALVLVALVAIGVAEHRGPRSTR